MRWNPQQIYSNAHTVRLTLNPYQHLYNRSRNNKDDDKDELSWNNNDGRSIEKTFKTVSNDPMTGRQIIKQTIQQENIKLLVGHPAVKTLRKRDLESL